MIATRVQQGLKQKKKFGRGSTLIPFRVNPCASAPASLAAQVNQKSSASLLQ
jgi:hypothetical protein